MKDLQDTRYRGTIYSCFLGIAVQAIIVNFAPLLFVTFNQDYGIPLPKITLLVTLCFLLQLTIDGVSAFVADKIGYRPLAVISHIASALGLVLLAILPDLLPDPYIGILIAVAVYSLGSGLLEVLMSPIMEACPTSNKEKAMSLMHSFYCWGQMGTVLISTLFFVIFGIRNWRILALIWAIVPVINAVRFMRVPIAQVLPEGERSMPFAELLKSKLFWVFMIAMMCGGASEQAVSQWASAFAESALGVSKALGDLLGPMLFALMMALSRTLYGKFGDRIDLDKFILYSSLACIAAYLITVFSPWPVLGLIGCGICGFTVGIFWPGTFSRASKALPRGGTALFCMLALAGDLGCTLGPTVVGFASSLANNNLKVGLLCAILFPIIMIVSIALRKKLMKK